MSEQLQLGKPITITVRVGREDPFSDPVDHHSGTTVGEFTAQAGTAVVGIYELE